MRNKQKIEAFIIAERTEHPHIGKAKLSVLLKAEGHTVSESYTGRVISDLKKHSLLPRYIRLSFNARTGNHHEIRQIRRKKLRRTHKRGMELDCLLLKLCYCK